MLFIISKCKPYFFFRFFSNPKGIYLIFLYPFYFLHKYILDMFKYYHLKKKKHIRRFFVSPNCIKKDLGKTLQSKKKRNIFQRIKSSFSIMVISYWRETSKFRLVSLFIYMYNISIFYQGCCYALPFCFCWPAPKLNQLLDR